MNKLVCAEWYRARKSYHLFRWILIFIALSPYLGLMVSGILEEKVALTDGFLGILETIMAFNIYISLFIAGMLVVSYENKLLHFDMMAGNKISHIILSKVIITAPVIALYSTACLAVVSAYVVYKNGVGDASVFLSYLLLYALIMLRIAVTSILITTIFKGALGVAVVFVRFAILDTFPSMILQEMNIDAKLFSRILDCFTTGQYYHMNGSRLDSEFIIIAIASMVVELLIWYVLSYISHKKRMFY